jgi:hypothetical protein
MEEKYFVWTIPGQLEIYIEDRGNIPVGGTEVKGFCDWDEAYDYGYELAKKKGYGIECDTEIERFTQDY